MARYISGRIFQFLLIAFAVSALSFSLGSWSPVDPLDVLMGQSENQLLREKERKAIAQQKARLYQELGFNKPLFYLSFGSLSDPSNPNIFYRKESRKLFKRLCFETGEDSLVKDYVLRLEEAAFLTELPSAKEKQRMIKTFHVGGLQSQIEHLEQGDSTAKALLTRLNSIKVRAHRWKRYIPVIRFHRSNRYHDWLFGLDGKKGWIHGNWGKSYVDNRSVRNRISGRLIWSLSLTLLAVLISFTLSLFLGKWMFRRMGNLEERWTSRLLFLIYAIPSFWMATLLLYVFANPDFLQWFPTGGIKPLRGYPPNANFLQKASISLPHLILPVLCYSYASIAYLSRLVKHSIRDEWKKPYAFGLQTRGLSKKKVLKSHVIPNSLFPLLTLVGSIFPALLGGSVVIESIFAIPGMGSLMYQSILVDDIPTIMTIVTLIGLLSALGYLVSDILYALFDPRVRFAKRKNFFAA